MASSEVHLYDLGEDPEESINLAKDAEYKEIVSKMISRLNLHQKRSVPPLHAGYENNGLPIYSFPPGQFFTGWCDDQKYANFKNNASKIVNF